MERSAGHCWLCGKIVIQMRMMPDHMSWSCDPKNGFYAVLIDIDQPATQENIIAICGSCAASRTGCRSLENLRLLNMRRQYDPLLTEKELRIVASNGGKASFVYHWFWFETQKGRAVIDSVLTRRASHN